MSGHHYLTASLAPDRRGGTRVSLTGLHAHLHLEESGLSIFGTPADLRWLAAQLEDAAGEWEDARG